MTNKKGVSILIVAILCSVLSSFLTVLTLKDRMIEDTSKTKSTKIVVNDEGRTQNVYHAITEKAMPSVVGITTTSINRNNMFAIPTQTEGVGTGIIVDSNGYILTNSHVVSDGGATSVNVLFNDGNTDAGKVLWYDSQLDLAIVKVEKTGLTPAEFGNSDEVRVGDISVAIGNPLGLEFQKSVTQGIISGLDRTIKTEQSNMTGLIQTDASINSGNSGGPLLNKNGQVIGINTAKASQAEGLGFAIPINTAKSIVEEVIKNGKYEKVTLGIKGMDLDKYEMATGLDLDGDKGVYIAEVISGSAADKANIKVGDVITKVGKIDITSMSDLNKVLYSYSKGSNSDIVVIRGGKQVTVNVKF